VKGPLLGETRIRVLAAAAVLLAALLLARAPFTLGLDLKVLDQMFLVRRALHPTRAPGVVLVGVDGDTEHAFPEPLALWHRHFAAVFQGLALGGARGVGVDYNLPERSFDGIIPGLDAALMRGILTLKAKCPLVLGLTVGADYRVRSVFAPFLRAAGGEEGSGLVVTPLDQDNYLRRFKEPPDVSGRPVPTMAGTLARRLGLDPVPGYVDYALGEPMTYVPFQQVAAWSEAGNAQALRGAFQDQVVFIGSVLPFEDRHLMPVNLAGWETDNNGLVPGVLFHAQTLRSLMGPGLIREAPPWAGLVLLIAATAASWGLSRWLGLGLGGLVILPGMLVLGAYTLLGHHLLLPVAGPAGGVLLGFLGRTTVEGSFKIRERRRLRQVFSGYVSPAILQEIVDGRMRSGLEGHRVNLCVMFSDIRDFTTLAEKLEPEEVIALLNRYFSRMTEAIHAHGGTLDKFIGDGIMCFYGAPEPMVEPCRNALGTAQDMLATLAELNGEFEREGGQPLRIGIGMHYGVASVGNMGSATRHEYTAVGNTVNTASRIEGLTKGSGYTLMVSQTVIDQLGNHEGFEFLGEKPLKGRAPMAVYGWQNPAAGRSSKGGSS
jgi:class 3 adenylate cyclase/CHASE2 domain-containing sensor protein